MAPQAGSGGFKAFLGKICPKPRGLSATSPAPEVFLGAPQRAIFAFRSRKGRARIFFFPAQNGRAQIFFAGQKGLALSFQNGDLDFFSGPKGASPPNSPHSPGASGSRPAEGRLVLILLEAACRRSPPHPSASPRTPRESRENLLVPPVKKGVVGGGKKSSVYA